MYQESTFPGDAEQDRILSEAKTAIKRNAHSMRKAVDEDNMREALRFSAAMLSELRTSQLSPQKYYELYMLVFDQLVNLEAFFGDERGKGRTYSELYELVQHAGNVLPRLYLMVAVGCLYIKSQEGAAKELLRDLVELCKGVQHPTRGLFLRSYLCQRSRGLLPDTGSLYEGPRGGSIADALDFLLSNFVEMNKLWVRMQHQGSARDKEKREKERQQLADLVGKNLTYISQLDGLSYALYSEQVLPRVMEQIISCKDDIAQQYLFQAVIQVFPDSFHLGTLDSLLGALPEMQPGVKVHSVMASLMDRLARYAAADSWAMTRLTEMRAFERFRDAIGRIISAQASMAPADAVEMYVALMNFTGSVHPNLVTNVNQVLAAAHAALAPRGLAGDSRAERALVALLTLPITKYDVVTGLGLSEYPLLMGLLRQRTHKELASRIVHSVLDAGTRITSTEKVAMMFRFIAPLVHDGPLDGSTPSGPTSSIDDLDDEDVQSEQLLVARLLHSLHSEDPATHFQLLVTAKEQLVRGGPRRLRHTLPALGFAALAIVRRLGTAEGHGELGRSLLRWLLGLALLLAELPEPLGALRLLLAGGLAASEEVAQELLAYEFFEQAFLLYEEQVAEQRARTTALQSIFSTLSAAYVFSSDNREALVQNAAGYASRLLRRSDQCKALCSCARLYWQPQSGVARANRDPTKVQGLLQRALRVAATAKQQLAAAGRTHAPASASQPSGNTVPGSSSAAAPATLFVEVLNHYLLYLELGMEGLDAAAVQAVLDQVQGELLAPAPAIDPETQRYWRSTVNHIHRMQAKGDAEVKARFAGLTVSPAAAAL
ncbi:vacuolar protein sorting-associated protein 35 [Haematococcus lacustris]